MAGLNRKAKDTEARENILILKGVKLPTRRVWGNVEAGQVEKES